MAEGKARKRSTGGEEAQVVTLDDGQIVDTITGEIPDDTQAGGFDEYQESPFNDLNQDGPLFDDSQTVHDEFSQLGRNQSAGYVIGAGRAA